MDNALLVVVTVSLLLTAGMAVVLLRIWREDRRRSEARVALLAEMSAEPASRQAEVIYDARLFDEHEEPSAWPGRLLAAGALAVVVVAAAAGWSFVGRRVAAPPAAAAPAASMPLELVSLAHQQVEGSFTITGLVQNPRAGTARSRVQVTAVVFGADGAVLGSGRAPLDVSSLAAGDESPFIVRIPVKGASRYRVGFRDEHDAPLGHVDRRDPGSLARKEIP